MVADRDEVAFRGPFDVKKRFRARMGNRLTVTIWLALERVSTDDFDSKEAPDGGRGGLDVANNHVFQPG